MIESNVYELIEQYSKILRLDLTSEEFARLEADKNCSEESIQTTCELFHHLAEKKQATTVHTLLKMSRLPLKNPKTFENFDFSVIKGRDVECLKNVSSLSALTFPVITLYSGIGAFSGIATGARFSLSLFVQRLGAYIENTRHFLYRPWIHSEYLSTDHSSCGKLTSNRYHKPSGPIP